MKLVSYEIGRDRELGVISYDGRWVFPLRPQGIEYKDMLQLIKDISDSQLKLLEHISKKDPYSISKAARLEEVRLLAPIVNPGQIICMGKNYLDHIRECENFSGSHDIEAPIFFSKYVNEAVSDGGYIPLHQDITQALDYECELSVIIRKDAKDIEPCEVRDYIFGYTIINDVSARDLQKKHNQWFFAKSLDGFCPMGPCILTADSVVYPPRLEISSYVNNELRQSSNTEYMIYDIDNIVSELSRGFCLKAGTIIATGTPKGVGAGFNPPKFLKAGDEVICMIEGIGRLKNIIKE